MTTETVTKPRSGKLRGGLAFCAVLLALVLLALSFGQDDLAATSGLFQSPETATVEPTATVLTSEPPTPTEPVELPTATGEPVTPEATSTPTPAEPPTEPPTGEAPTAVTKEPMPTEPIIEPTETAPAATEVPPESAGVEETEPPSRYSDDESSLVFDWGTLFDSLALGLSYGWLCCGIVLTIGLPVLFVALWSRSRREQGPEEEEEE